jgi:hypothetical protein
MLKSDTPDANVVVTVSERKYPQVTKAGNAITINPRFKRFIVTGFHYYPVLQGRQDKIGAAGRQESPADPGRIHHDIIVLCPLPSQVVPVYVHVPGEIPYKAGFIEGTEGCLCDKAVKIHPGHGF